MNFKKYFWRNWFSSAFVFFLLIGAIVLVNRPDIFQNLLSKIGLTSPVNNDIAHSFTDSEYPESLVPFPSQKGEWIKKPNYLIYYDQDIMQARFALHKLESADTRGSANRHGLRFNENEPTMLPVASYSDYSGSGFDRGHLVPAADFQCCQEQLEETFAMSNVAPFDSLLNRYAWAELEKKTRQWARRYGELYVITGPVFEHRMQYFGKYTDISVPTHFYKLLVRYSTNSSIPESTIAFLLPNEPTPHFVMERQMVSIDDLEAKTGLDFFKSLPDELEDKLENARRNGSW